MKKNGKKWRQLQKEKEARRANLPPCEVPKQEHVCPHFKGKPFEYRLIEEVGTTLKSDGTLEFEYSTSPSLDGSNLESLLRITRKAKCYCKKCKTIFQPDAISKMNDLIQYLKEPSWTAERATVLAENIEPVRYCKGKDRKFITLSREKEYYSKYHELFPPQEKNVFRNAVHICNHLTSTNIEPNEYYRDYRIETDFSREKGDKFHCKSLLVPLSSTECQCLNCKKTFSIDAMTSMNKLIEYLIPQPIVSISNNDISQKRFEHIYARTDLSENDKEILIELILAAEEYADDIEAVEQWKHEEVEALSRDIEAVYYRCYPNDKYEYVTKEEYKKDYNSRKSFESLLERIRYPFLYY